MNKPRCPKCKQKDTVAKTLDGFYCAWCNKGFSANGKEETQKYLK